jgi:deoxyribose-phosphate aldolase
VCIYAQFVGTAKQALSANGTPQVKVATVVNFPHGGDDVEKAVKETRDAVAAGADEIDVVFPYKRLLAGDEDVCKELVERVKAECTGPVLLKVIIETGELKEAAMIKRASEIAIGSGADFIKTSTGKVAVNATLESAEIMMTVIRDLGVKDKVGFKPAGGPSTRTHTHTLSLSLSLSLTHSLSRTHTHTHATSGGVKTAQDAKAYLDLADKILGADWADARHFRFGASSLRPALLSTLQGGDGAASSGY